MGNRLLELIIQSTGGLSTSGMVLRIALIACSIVALVHLFSLWGTRYGDHNTLAKSFFMSIIFHCCLGLGWATVAETYPRGPLSSAPEAEVTAITFLGEVDSAPIEGKNSEPFFQSGPLSSGFPLGRDAHTSARLDMTPEVADIPEPEREKAPTSKVIPDVPNISPTVDEPAPKIEHPTDHAPTSTVDSIASIEQPALEAQPQLDRTVSRETLPHSVDLPEAAPKTGRTRSPAVQMAPVVDDGEIARLPTDDPTDAVPRPAVASQGESIRRPATPAPTVDNEVAIEREPTTDDRPSIGSIRTNRRPSKNPAPGVGQDEITTRPSMASRASTMKSNAAPLPPAEDRTITGPTILESTDDTPQPSLDRLKTNGISKAPARAPETYRARTSGQRMSSVLKNGGSEDSERAVENSLKWLASVQEDDGRWSSSRNGGGSVSTDPDGRDRINGGKFADSGVTGLVILSFLGAGYTHEKGPYTSEVRSAVNWLIDQQAKNGFLAGEATRFDQNYCHAIATFALAEAYAMQKDASEFPELRQAVRRGVDYIAAIQNEDGGWRYGRGDSDDSDMSMFGWQLMALKSAVNGGIAVPEKTRRGMVRFLEKRSRGKEGGLAGYRTKDQPTPAMTAEALFCRQMFTVRDNDAASQEAVSFLLQNLPKASAYDEYYWYYGTLAMRQVDGASWNQWNNSLRDLLVSMQRQNGLYAGSWDPRGKWAGIGGRLYSTALSTMCLEAYYRYQANPKPNDNP